MADKSIEEQPKRRVAKKVIAEKRTYFVPDHGVSVKAETADEAVSKAVKKVDAPAEKEGDAN